MAEREDHSMLGRYLGENAAALIRSAASRPESLGDSYPACVLFADIRGYSRLAERVDLPSLRRFLGEFVGMVVETVEEAGGMVNKFLGDGALALFAEPPDAGRAAAAALALHAAFLSLRGRRGQTDAAFADIDLGLGLAYGEIFLGNIGMGERYDFTAIGRPVNIAERLAHDAPENGAGGVFCDGGFMAQLADSAPAARSLGHARLRGMSAETEIFQLQPPA